MSDQATTSPLPRLGAGIEEVAAMIGVGRSLLIQADKTGEFGPRFRKLGQRKIASVTEVAAWLAAGMPNRTRWVETWAEILRKSQAAVPFGPASGEITGQQMSRGVSGGLAP